MSKITFIDRPTFQHFKTFKTIDAVGRSSGANLVRSLGVVDSVTEIFNFIRKNLIFKKNFRFSGRKIPMTFLVINCKNRRFSKNN